MTEEMATKLTRYNIKTGKVYFEKDITREENRESEEEKETLLGRALKHKHFIKSFAIPHKELLGLLEQNRTYHSMFCFLSPVIVNNLNFIGKRGEYNGWEPMSAKEIIGYLQVSKATFYRFIKVAKESNLIAVVNLTTGGNKEGIEHYFINPRVSMKGGRPNDLLIYFFKNDKKLIRDVLQKSTDKEKERIEDFITKEYTSFQDEKQFPV